MKLKDIIRPPRNEQGVALLIALAVLVLMAILAVSFYSSQDLEGQAATNAYYARSAQAAAQGGLEWAIALIESDMDPTTGVVLGYDTDFDVWGPRAHETGLYPQPDKTNPLFNTGRINDVDLSDLVAGDDARWIKVERPLPGGRTRIVGRFAAIIECENGKANANVLGNKDDAQADGISPAEVSLQTIFGEIPGGNSSWADDIISERNGTTGPVGGGDTDGDGPTGYVLCDDDLDGDIDGDDADGDAIGEPDQRNMYNMLGDGIAYLDLSTVRLKSTMTAAELSNIRDYITVNSRTQNVYKLKPADDLDTNDWAEQLSINSASAADIRAKLNELATVPPPHGPRLPAVTPEILDQIAANMADFVDDDNEPTQRGARYGIEKTPYLNEVEAKPATYSITVGALPATVYDHGEFIELINPYDVDITVTLVTHRQGATGVAEEVTLTNITVPARTSDTQAGYYVIGDTSRWYVDPNTGLPVYEPDVGQGPGGCDQYENLHLDSSRTIKLQLPGGASIQEVDFGDEGAEGPETRQKDDPRVDEWETHNGTPKAQNEGWRKDLNPPADPEPADITLAELFVVYDGKLGSVGHLGRVHAGKKWATIDLTGDDLGGNWDDVHKRESWLNIYDVFTTKESKLASQPRHGLININTAPEEVLRGLKDVDAASLYDQTHPDLPSARRVFESIAEIGEFLPIEAPGSELTWGREKHLADIAGLVTVRSHVFRVTLLAQAVDRQGNMVGESKLEASVLRTIDTSTGRPNVRVLSTRWIFEE